MIDLNGAIQFIERRKQIKKLKLMQRTTWVLYNLINAENVEPCEHLARIIVANVKDASTAWIITVLGPTIALDI